MKKIMFWVVLMFAATIFASGDKDTQEKVMSMQVTSQNLLLVDLDPGNVTISTWDKNEVLVRLRDRGEYDDGDVSITSSGNKIILKSSAGWAWNDEVECDITIPKKFNILVKLGSGDIRINSDLAGDVELFTEAGDIKTKNITGTAKLYTRGGDITAGDIKGNAEINTSGGDIRVERLMGSISKIQTDAGDVDIKEVKGNLDLFAESGDVWLKESAEKAKIVVHAGSVYVQKGSGILDVMSTSGDISIDSFKGNLKLKTGAGDVTAKEAAGYVNIFTNYGDVHIDLDPARGSTSIIETESGDIYFTTSSKAKTTILAEVKSYSGDENGIQFNFDTETIEFNTKYDKKNNTLLKTFILNAGGSTVKLQTDNSEIYIYEN